MNNLGPALFQGLVETYKLLVETRDLLVLVFKVEIAVGVVALAALAFSIIGTFRKR